ncbi:MAG: DUF6460 domain-containing protein [Pseudomonadota bacterium]
MSPNQIFGGNPLSVIIRLALLSVVVGIILSALGIAPDNLLYSLQLLASRLYHFGADTLQWAFQYFLLGAAIVVPIWLITRVFSALTNKRAKDRDDGA